MAGRPCTGVRDRTQRCARANRKASAANTVAATRFIHRSTDNTVWYDADGNDAGAAVLIATLQGGVTGTPLTNADFLIF